MSEPTNASIGEYEVVRRLEQPGEAYLARSADSKRYLVELFAASPDTSSWDEVRRQVAICAALDHPAIAKIINHFEHEAKLAVVTECEGIELDELLKSGSKLDDKVVWYVGHQLAGALSQAHSATDPTSGDFVSICHGHLSPRRVWVTPNGEVQIIGFGLAPLVGSDGMDCQPGYQAPEESKGGRVTPRGDIYSAAAIVWALLTGGQPTAGEAKLDLGGLSDKLPGQLADILDRALEPSLGKRKITSMELEQWFADVADSEAAKQALAAGFRAVNGGSAIDQDDASAKGPPPPLRPKLEGSAAPRPGGTPKPPPLKPSSPGSPSKPVKVRSRQKTLVGSPSPKYAGSAKTAEAQAPPEPSPSVPDLAGLDQTISLSESVDVPDTSDAVDLPALDWTDEKLEDSSPGVDVPSLDWGDELATDNAAGAAPSPDVDDEAATAKVDLSMLKPEAKTAEAVPSGPDDVDDEAATAKVDLSMLKPQAAAAPTATTADDGAGGLAGLKVTMALDEDGSVPEEPAAPSAADDSKSDDAKAAPPAAEPDYAATIALDQDVLDTAPMARDTGSGPGAPAAADSAPGDSPPPGKPADSEPVAASPWGTGEQDGATPVAATGAKRKRLSWGKLLLVVLLVAAVVLVVGIVIPRYFLNVEESSPPKPSATSSTSTGAKPPPTVARTATAKPTAKPTAPITATAAATATASATASASATATTSATTSASATAESSATPPAGASVDAAKLPPNVGLLKVNFVGPSGGKVYLFAQSFGNVGVPLKVPCGGGKFVRVGRPPGPTWLSGGQSVFIKCQALTEVTLRSP